jgi:hypothetical protein
MNKYVFSILDKIDLAVNRYAFGDRPDLELVLFTAALIIGMIAVYV